jgi:hypothetical protein
VSSELADFLRARIDADQQWATDVLNFGRPDDHGFARRTLADVAAKRLLVDAFDQATQYRHTPGPGSEQLEGRIDGFEEAVRFIASAWSTHPDYRSEWAPDAE